LPAPAESAERSSAPAARQILLLGVWAGLVGGLGEGLLLLLATYGFHRLVFRGLDSLWMAPVSFAVLGTLTAVPLASLARSRVGRRWPGLPFFVLALLTLLNVSPDIPKVHALARLILLTGIAAATARQAAKHTGAVLRFVQMTLVPLLGLVVLLALGVRGGRWIQERRALAALPRAAPAAPNVLFLMLDTVRALDLSLYGYSRLTSPALDRLAARAVVFERAYAPSSWTLNSHASVFTGRRPFETGVGWTRPLDRSYPTLAEVLRARGYLTAGFSANSYYVTRESGLARGFVHFDDRLITPKTVLLGSSLAATLSTPIRKALHWYQPPEHKSAARLRAEVSGWLAEQPDNRPFFVFANFFDAHAPYLPPAPFDTAFIGRRIPWRERNLELDAPNAVTVQEAAVERAAYDQVVAAQDHQLGLLLDDLEVRGLLKNTLIVVTADHGEEFGEWGFLSHGNSLNPAALWVPLLVAFTGRLAAPMRIADQVSLLDLSATILGLAEPTRQSELPGFPLLRLGRPEIAERHSPSVAEMEYAPDTPAWFRHGAGPLRAVMLPGWHYARESGGRETLLDTATDPAGRRVDLNTPSARTIVRAAKAVLDSLGPATPVRSNDR
jgi:arylsulfatase A-like enzyme